MLVKADCWGIAVSDIEVYMIVISALMTVSLIAKVLGNGIQKMGCKKVMYFLTCGCCRKKAHEDGETPEEGNARGQNKAVAMIDMSDRSAKPELILMHKRRSNLVGGSLRHIDFDMDDDDSEEKVAWGGSISEENAAAVSAEDAAKAKRFTQVHNPSFRKMSSTSSRRSRGGSSGSSAAGGNNTGRDASRRFSAGLADDIGLRASPTNRKEDEDEGGTVVTRHSNPMLDAKMVQDQSLSQAASVAQRKKNKISPRNLAVSNAAFFQAQRQETDVNNSSSQNVDDLDRMIEFDMEASSVATGRSRHGSIEFGMEASSVTESYKPDVERKEGRFVGTRKPAKKRFDQEQEAVVQQGGDGVIRNARGQTLEDLLEVSKPKPPSSMGKAGKGGTAIRSKGGNGKTGGKKKVVVKRMMSTPKPVIERQTSSGALHTPHDSTPFGRGGGRGEGQQPKTTSDHIVLQPGQRIVRATVLTQGSAVKVEYASDERGVVVRHIATFNPSSGGSGVLTAMQETEASGKDGIQTRAFAAPYDGTLTQTWSTEESGFFANSTSTNLSFSTEVTPGRSARGMTLAAAGRAKSTHFDEDDFEL